EVALGVLVHEPDRRAGEDVVELLQEQELPQAVELGPGIRAAAREREELRVVQALLGPAISALHACLRRVRAPVELEVQLADDDRSRGGLRFERLEELGRRRRPRSREPLEIPRAAKVLQHLARRPAAPVAVAEDEKARA